MKIAMVAVFVAAVIAIRFIAAPMLYDKAGAIGCVLFVLGCLAVAKRLESH